MILDAFAPTNNNQSIRNFSTGSGKSNSFFLFTDNKQFVLKTLRPSEETLLFQKGGVLGPYYEHITQHPDSLISKVLGVFRVKLQMMDEPITFLIMDSLIGNEYKRIKRLYDLKGSTLQRFVQLSEEEEQNGSGLKTLKDQNFNGMDISVPEKERIVQLLALDSEFLMSQSLMDYSMLLTVTRIAS